MWNDHVNILVQFQVFKIPLPPWFGKTGQLTCFYNYFQCYSLATVGYRVATFNDCVEASHSLKMVRHFSRLVLSVSTQICHCGSSSFSGESGKTECGSNVYNNSPVLCDFISCAFDFGYSKLHVHHDQKWPVTECLQIKSCNHGNVIKPKLFYVKSTTIIRIYFFLELCQFIRM